jgi:hypothetical protein
LDARTFIRSPLQIQNTLFNRFLREHQARILFSTDFFENTKEARLANRLSGLSSSLAGGHTGNDLDVLNF